MRTVINYHQFTGNTIKSQLLTISIDFEKVKNRGLKKSIQQFG